MIINNIADDNEESQEEEEKVVVVKKIIKKKVVAKDKPVKKADVKAENKYEYPELLILDDEEKFNDNEGNVVEIETRGERTAKGIYFLCKDVSNVFDLQRLDNTL